MQREAKKGQGMKSLAGSGAAPQAGFRAAALTYPKRGENKNRSGAEGDYCDSADVA